jgi:hypothetical protein
MDANEREWTKVHRRDAEDAERKAFKRSTGILPVCRVRVPSMFDRSGCKSRSNLMEVKDSQAQGRCREAGSERRARQRRGSMNKNRIRGVSVGRAGVPPQSPYPSRTRSVDPATVRRKQSNLPREICPMPRRTGAGRPARAADPEAEVSRGHSSPSNVTQRHGTSPAHERSCGHAGQGLNGMERQVVRVSR